MCFIAFKIHPPPPPAKQKRKRNEINDIALLIFILIRDQFLSHLLVDMWEAASSGQHQTLLREQEFIHTSDIFSAQMEGCQVNSTDSNKNELKI